jgi:hypothetical protein
MKTRIKVTNGQDKKKIIEVQDGYPEEARLNRKEPRSCVVNFDVLSSTG